MTSEFALDYRFAVESPADAHYAHALVDLMEGGHNPYAWRAIKAARLTPAGFACGHSATSA